MRETTMGPNKRATRIRPGRWGMLAALLTAGILIGGAVPRRAAAGPPESPATISIHPNNPDLWVVRYDYVGGGMLFSEDAGASWKLLCNAGIDVSLSRDTIGLVVSASGDAFTGVFSGMWRIGSGGCGYSMEPTFDEWWVSDMSPHPTDPNTIYAITSSGNKENGVYVYDAAADTWSPSGTREMLLISRIRAATNGDGVRLYESMSDGETMVMDPETGDPRYYPNYFIRYSDDNGDTWTAYPGFEQTEGNIRLEAVDPTDPNRIVVSESFGKDDPRSDRLWINDAAGETSAYKMLAEVGLFGGATFGPEGQLWFSDYEGAISILNPGEDTPTELSADARARCLTYQPAVDKLFACQLFTVGEVGDDGSITTVLDFRTVGDWVSCDGTSVAATCETQNGLSGWCGPSHYPDAGVCAAYCYPGHSDTDPGAAPTAKECDPNAPAPTPSPTPKPGPGDGDGTVPDPMVTPDMNTGDGDGTTPQPAGMGGSEVTMMEPTMAPAPPADEDSGGCALADPGGNSSDTHPLLWALTLVGVAWIRRRRRTVR